MAPSFLTRFRRGLKAFREQMISTSHVEIRPQFSDFQARRLRYGIYWSFYENSAYRNLHSWSQTYRTEYGLYKYIRQIYNPSYRLGEFWKTYLMGGLLDPQCGDGKITPSALPIIIPPQNRQNDALVRRALAQVWAWSNWQSNKDLLTLYGPMLGDVFIEVVDDTESERVYLDIIHPGNIADVTFDRRGNIRSYVYVELVPDPESSVAAREVEFHVDVTRSGDDVVYRTYRDNQPFAWDSGQGSEWKESYGFIPLVMVRHNNVGLDWGWSELHAGRHKFQELDDLASKVHDHVRKYVDPAWFLSGVSKKKQEASLDKAETTPTTDRPQPEREELPAIYASNPQAKALPLVAELDLDATVGLMKILIEEIERDYPELQMDIWRAIQSNSGRALRVARKRSESKVIQRRANYDAPLVRAQMMALSIGGMRNYPAFEGITLDSFAQGTLDHYIGNRAVYDKDPMDDLEVEQVFWDVASVAVPLVGLEFYLRKHGWEDADILEAVKAQEKMQESQMRRETVENEEEPLTDSEKGTTINRTNQVKNMEEG